jgi:hypothetical protein
MVRDTEQLMFQEFYESHFRDIFGSEPEPEDGLGDEAVEARLAARGLRIPLALFDYYSLVGYHWINRQRNRLRTIEELDWYGDWLVFMDDDQGIVSWGIHKQDVSNPDPVVWQGVLGEETDWLQDTTTLSQFFVDIWKELL